MRRKRKAPAVPVSTMGVLVNRRLTTAVASLVAALVVALNVYLLVQIFAGR